MNEPAVNWYEGMFLRPHHFQRAELHWRDQLRQSSVWDVHYNWGLRALEIDPTALRNYRFVVNRLQARLRDGTLIRVPEDASLDHLELKGPLNVHSPVEVALAVPKVEDGVASVGTQEEAAARYHLDVKPNVFDQNTGANAREVKFRRLNLRLLTAGANNAGYAGYEVLPIAKVERSALTEAVPQLYAPYIPPVLACEGWAALRNDILQPVWNQLGQLARQRAEQVQTRGITFDSQSSSDRKIFETLRILNEASAYFGIFARADGIHPLPAYLELCRLVGQLAVFGADPELPKLPQYDHDDLGHCFYTVKRYLDDLLKGDFEIGYEQRPFIGSGLKMKVELKAEWLAGARQMFVGVDCPLPATECVKLLTGHQLDMKIGSVDRVDEIFSRGLSGLAFNYASTPPRALPPGNTYFQINRESSQAEWKNVQATLALAVRLNQRLLAGTIDGKKVVAIQSEGLTTSMTFTLYVVGPAKAGG